MEPMFTRYLALGDSISIDYYPSTEHRGKKLGAASLLYRNDDEIHPEFREKDLATRYPGIRFNNAHDGVGPTTRHSDNLTLDGATTHDVLDDVRILEKTDEKLIVTLTIGGNDLLGAVQLRGAGKDTNPPEDIANRTGQILEILLGKAPNAEVLVTTVYDPTDGTYRLPLPDGETIDLRPVGHWLEEYNAALRTLTTTDPRLHLADIHPHFLGHGTSAVSKEEFWYWPTSIIEPGERGASEVRRVWWDTLTNIA